MHLSRDVLKQMIMKQDLVSNFADLDGQLTANGFDVRLAGVIEVRNAGKLAIAKEHNKPPVLGKAAVLEGFENRLHGYDIPEKRIVRNGCVTLERLQPYLVVCCEEVKTPVSLMIHITARSSLFRLTQSLLGCTFGEAGYRGYLTFLLLPFLDGEIELGARFAQLSFSELKGTAQYTEQKQSSYQGGKLF
ncbi:hypothetical protein HY639_00580 [Candidatus Woesearchaeota archaeon]|nr:hypothetical protein [Candidatus Woesearchaeota archaeon]